MYLSQIRQIAHPAQSNFTFTNRAVKNTSIQLLTKRFFSVKHSPFYSIELLKGTLPPSRFLACKDFVYEKKLETIKSFFSHIKLKESDSFFLGYQVCKLHSIPILQEYDKQLHEEKCREIFSQRDSVLEKVSTEIFKIIGSFCHYKYSFCNQENILDLSRQWIARVEEIRLIGQEKMETDQQEFEDAVNYVTSLLHQYRNDIT